MLMLKVNVIKVYTCMRSYMVSDFLCSKFCTVCIFKQRVQYKVMIVTQWIGVEITAIQ